MSRGAVLLPISYLNIDEGELEKLIKEEQQLQMNRLKELKSKLFGSKMINEEEIQAVINKHRSIY